ncbi:MAG: hypothetical protein RLZ98_66 [Pseudomonadota bacterium]|jgi:carboxylesterase
MTGRDHTYKLQGNNVGVLLLHGLCGTPTEVRYVANGMARAGYTVHCPQLAGHCGSAEDIKATTWEDWYRSAEDALDEMRETCDVVVAGGLSTGALLALLLAARQPDKVQGTALYAPTLWLNGWLIPWYARFFRLCVHKTIANMIPFPDLHPHGIKDPRIREFILNALNSGDSSIAGLPATPGGAVLEHRWLAQEVRRQLGRITQPSLIVHPREDDYADLSNAWHIQRNLKGKVEMVVLEDSYHIVTVDRQRDVVVERTQSFVKSVATATGARSASRQRQPQTAMVAAA